MHCKPPPVQAMLPAKIHARQERRKGKAMTARIVPIPCLRDNFAFLIISGAEAALIDVPEAAPILRAIRTEGVRLREIVLTHHHDDHVQGLAALLGGPGGLAADGGPRPVVMGAAADRHRLPPLDRALVPGERLTLAGLRAEVIDAPGHTVGHIAIHVPEAAALFSGDSLMAMGCGRLFEGTAAQMWATLSRLAGLALDTRVWSGHDYIAGNAAFAAHVEPGNPEAIARAAAHRLRGGTDHLFVTLAQERATNPFLRPDSAEIRARLGLHKASAAEVFAALRRAKDDFRPAGPQP
jgi:hydroxyacylglutathione hydrolase